MSEKKARRQRQYNRLVDLLTKDKPAALAYAAALGEKRIHTISPYLTYLLAI